MNSADQFHLGIVVDDYEGTLTRLSALFGYEWCDEMTATQTVSLLHGEETLEMRFTYSMTSPRLEIIRPIPGTLWQPSGAGVHHVGYWSDDVTGDAAALERTGFEREAAGVSGGAPYWTYHRDSSGLRIELISRALQPAMEQYWATGKVPSA